LGRGKGVTTVLIAISAGLGALVVVLLALLMLRRPVKEADTQVAELVASLSARMDEMSKELVTAIERAEEEGRRSRFLSELAGTIDLDEVLSRTLEAAGAMPGVDAAMISISNHEGQPLVATLGLSTEEAERQAVTGPPDGGHARSITLVYRYTSEELEANGSVVHSGLAVPLAGDTAPMGYLSVFTRAPDRPFGEEDLRALEDLALRAAPAIDNAQRFREARQLADLDALTGLHNRRFFHETLAREVSRAQRYGRNLALVVFDLDDFKEVNDRVGHLAGDAVLAEAAERVRGVVRAADIACRVGGDEFAVILPESTLADADQLYARIQQAVSTKPIGSAGKLYLSAGVAELRTDDEPRTFFERADEALYRAKDAGKGRALPAEDSNAQ
jgi:diguanylate cyclase (GGDEF)-like protein